MERTLIDCLQAHAAEYPDKVFWRQISGSQIAEVTFAQFRARAMSFAAAYAASGVARGEVVLIFLPQQADAVAAFFGAMLAGGIPSFMPCPSEKQHPAVYWPAHAQLLRRVGRHAIVSDRTHLAQMRQHGIIDDAGRALAIEDVVGDPGSAPAVDVSRDDIALLQHSSGTTGLKKGVALSHRAIMLQVAAYAERLQMTEADGVVSWLPLYHDMGLIACTVMPLVLGQTVTCLDPFRWVARPSSLFDAICRFDGRFAWLPNFAFEHLVRAVPDEFPGDLSSMRAFINCSEPCMADTFDRFVARFSRLGVRAEQMQVCYAMAETVFAVSQTAAGERARPLAVDAARLRADGVAAKPLPGAAVTRLLSAGRPLPGIDAGIVRDGVAVAEGVVGEVVLRGAMLFDGYHNDPETTAARLSGGTYRTRDRGFLHDGELYVLGREDDLLIVNGRNLHAHEVESLLAGIAGIKPGRAIAFGVFNEDVGSEELVVVAERDADLDADGATGQAVRRAVFEATGIEVKVCRIVDPGWLVKTTSGKIGRSANRIKHLGEVATTTPASDRRGQPESGALARLAAFLEEWFKRPAASIDARTIAGDVPGWDSLAHSTMMLGIEKAFDVRFADNEIFGFNCVGDLARRIEALSAAGRPEAAVRDRVVHKTAAASIVRLGDGAGPDLIVFAGRSKSFGGLELMDFASVFAGTSAEHATKYFVTDHRQDWYVTCFDEVTAKLNALSDRPKILFGNSMGGYAALRFASALRRVEAVLSVVPQCEPPRGVLAGSKRDAADWQVRLLPWIRYCVLFGESEDEHHKAHIAAQITRPDQQNVILVPNCGHNLAPYLAQEKLLGQVLECIVRPETMAREIAAIVGRIPPAPEKLQRRLAQVRRKNGGVAPSAPAQRRGPRRKPDAAPPDPGALERNFGKANVTRDGRLTLEQAVQAMPRVAKRFRAIDVQDNGYITVADILAFREKRRSGGPEPVVAAGRTAPAGAPGRRRGKAASPPR